jgi:outer membrane murein-binding lipoprotein Lpp
MVVAMVLAVSVIGGCGTSVSSKVQAKVQQFAHAVATHDAKTLCTEVFAPALVDHFVAAGIPCERAMQIYLRTVHDPTLAVGRVVINGNKAEAITLSGAKHQIGALDAVELVNTSNGWRVDGLGSPLLPGAAKKKKK